jgi:hypothetical protein
MSPSGNWLRVLILIMLKFLPPLPTKPPNPPAGVSTLAEKLALLPLKSAGVGDMDRFRERVDALRPAA